MSRTQKSSCANADGSDDLSGLLAPVDPSEFFDCYLDRQPLHVDRDDRTRFENLINLSALDALISDIDWRFPDVQVVRADQRLEPALYTDADGNVQPLAALRCWRDGGTLIVSRAQRQVAALASLCRNIQFRHGMHCETNLYCSPPGGQGFRPHYDTHDVLILQVSGAKTFRLFDGGPALPMARHRFDAEQTPIGPCRESIELQAGQTLYIPRGVLHDALATGAAPSLHITLGLYPIRLVDLLEACIEDAVDEHVDWRKALSHATLTGDEGTLQALSGRLIELLTTHLDATRLCNSLDRLRDDILLETRPAASGTFDGADLQPPLSAASRLTPRPMTLMSLHWQEQALVVRRPGQIIEFEAPMSQAVDAVLRAKSMCVGELPGLDHEQALALARRLVAEGLVTQTG